MGKPYYNGEYLCVCCHQPTNTDYLFCQNCYHAYKNREPYFIIEQGKNIQKVSYLIVGRGRNDLEAYKNNVHDLYSPNGINCVICGKDSTPYLLCKECYRNSAKDTLLISIGGCKNVAYIRNLAKKELADLTADAEEDFDEEDDIEEDDIEEDDIEEDDASNECLICGAECYSYHFCSSCYTKYLKNKEALLRISNGIKTELLDSSYPTPYRCEDGHRVRSKSEREIDNYLFRNRITHVYEQPIFLDEESEEPIHPDFYLPDLDIYIEHLGMDITDSRNQTYIDQWEYKRKLYRTHKMTIICTHEISDTEDINTSLERKLRRYTEGAINYEQP